MTNKLKYAFLAVVFLLGYTSLSFELIILRQLINFVGSNTLITSIVITVILLFLSVGYYIGSVIRFSRYPIRKVIIRLIKMVAIWYIFTCSYYLMSVYLSLMYVGGVRSTIAYVTLFSLIFLAFPSAALGFVTSVVGRFIHRRNSDYTGRFMAVDTIGSVLGSLATTLLLMPLFGVSTTIVVLTTLTLAAAILLTPKSQMLEMIVFTILIIIATVALNNEQLMSGRNTLVKDDAVSRIEIEPADFKDNQPQSLVMRINGSFSSKISQDEDLMFDYIKFINNTFIKTLPNDKPRDILILGAGGFTIGLNDTFHNYTFLDIEKDLQTISETKFLLQPLPENQKFIVQDAYLYMLNTSEQYDLIVVDVFSAIQSIPMNFVTEDFFLMVKKRLKGNGIMVANIITSPTFSNTFSKRIDNTLRSVFPQYLDRKVLQPYDAYDNSALTNIEYIYYNYPADNTIYTLNKNSAVYGQ